MTDLPDQDNAKHLPDHKHDSKTQGRNSFLTVITYDVLTWSRSFANEEVQNDKCFLRELCYFKMFKRHKDVVCISMRRFKKRKSLCMFNNWVIE